MKKTLIILSMLICWIGAQGQQKSAVDSAELIVQQYYNLLNYDGLRNDSILYIETIIYKRTNPTDTAIMKRWFLAPNKARAELWHGDTLLEGAYSDGNTIFREYQLGILTHWTRVADSRYYNIAPNYDFRGALYHRKADAAVLKYEGIWDFNGNPVYRIFVDTPYKYCRNYLFEKESGLLFLIQETNQHSEYTSHQAYDHPDWHAYHEYQPLGDVLIPSVESYQMDGDVVYYFSKSRYVPMNMDIFTKD